MTREQAYKLIRAQISPNLPDGPFDVTEVMRDAAIDALIAAVEKERELAQKVVDAARQYLRVRREGNLAWLYTCLNEWDNAHRGT